MKGCLVMRFPMRSATLRRLILILTPIGIRPRPGTFAHGLELSHAPYASFAQGGHNIVSFEREKFIGFRSLPGTAMPLEAL